MLGSSLRPLRHRNFALLWSAALVSNVGSWMQTVALGVLVTARTHQPLWTGLVAAAAFVPMGLMAPVGGVMADRYDRRRLLLATTAGETVFAAGLAVLAATGNATPALAVVMAFSGATFSAIGFPAYQAMLPDLVGEEELLGAVSLSSAQYNMGRVLGPALAGVVLVGGSYVLAFAINAASFGAVMVALVMVELPRRVRSSSTGALARVREGLQVTRRSAGARSAVLLISLVALSCSPFIGLVPAMAFTALHSRAAGTAVLVTAQGMGAVLGALAMAPAAARLGRWRLVVASLFALPLTLVAYGMAPSLALSAIAIFAVGFAYIGVLSGLNTVVQVSVPPEARGRALGFYMMALGTIYPVGLVIQGALGDQVGVRWVTIGAGAVFLVAFQAVVAMRRSVVDALSVVDSVPRALADPVEPGDLGARTEDQRTTSP